MPTALSARPCCSVMGYDDLDVVDPTAGEATSGKEAAISEVRPPPPAAQPPPFCLASLLCAVLWDEASMFYGHRQKRGIANWPEGAGTQG